MPNKEPGLRTALALFNGGHFFEAHEALEDLWRALPPSHPAKKPTQGLVQIAVAMHHESRGNFQGATSVFDRALRNLSGAERSLPEIDLDQLRRELALWRSYLADGKQRPALPRITLRKPIS